MDSDLDGAALQPGTGEQTCRHRPPPLIKFLRNIMKGVNSEGVVGVTLLKYKNRKSCNFLEKNGGKMLKLIFFPENHYIKNSYSN